MQGVVQWHKSFPLLALVFWENVSYLAFPCIYSPCFHTYVQMFESKLILRPPKPSTWLTFTTNPVLERWQYPIWLPSIILVIFNLLAQSNRKIKEMVTIQTKLPFQCCIKHQNRTSTSRETWKTSSEVKDHMIIWPSGHMTWSRDCAKWLRPYSPVQTENWNFKVQTNHVHGISSELLGPQKSFTYQNAQNSERGTMVISFHIISKQSLREKKT